MSKMTREEAIKWHRARHEALDELLAHFAHEEGMPLTQRPIIDLCRFSHRACTDPRCCVKAEDPHDLCGGSQACNTGGERPADKPPNTAEWDGVPFEDGSAFGEGKGPNFS